MRARTQVLLRERDSAGIKSCNALRVPELLGGSLFGLLPHVDQLTVTGNFCKDVFQGLVFKMSGDLVSGPLNDNLTLMEKYDAIANGLNISHIMRGVENRQVFFETQLIDQIAAS